MTETTQTTHPELEGTSTARLVRQGARLRRECMELEQRAEVKRQEYLRIADELIRVRQEQEVAPLAREWGMTFQNLRKQLGTALWTAMGYSPDRRGQLTTTAQKEQALEAAGWTHDPIGRWTPPGGGSGVLLAAAWNQYRKAVTGV